MENASRALFIAAGVILGVLLLSIMIYVFRQGARVQQTYDQKQITNQLELYNSKFEQYDRDNNTIMDVISLCNLAFDINIDSNFDSTNAVEIEIDIGNATFRLPNTGEKITQRNTLLSNSNSDMSIYELAYLPLNEGEKNLGITPSLIEDGSLAEATDKLTTTKLKNGKTIYKFLFKVKDSSDFEYHPENLKVSKIKLTAYCNSEWNEDDD